MGALVAPVLVLLAGLLEVCTGCLRDANGLSTVDLVLVVTLFAANRKGLGAGLLCGFLGGLVVGGPGGVPISTALVYCTAGALAAATHKRSVPLAMLQTAAIAAATTLALSGTGPSVLSGDFLSVRAVVPQLWHNGMAVLLMPVAARLAGRR